MPQPYLDSGNPGGAGDFAFLVSSHAGVAIQGPHLEHHLLEIIKGAFEKKPGFEGSLPCSGAFLTGVFVKCRLDYFSFLSKVRCVLLA